MKFPGFLGGSATGQSLIADAERTVNLYVEPSPVGPALYPTPGFSQWAQVPAVGSRSFTVANGRFFGVVGGGFYEWDLTGTATLRGAVAVDGSPAQIVFNGIVGGQLGIAAGGNIYSFILATNAFAGPHLAGGFTHLAYAAGFGLAFQATTGKVFVGALNDFTTWPAGVFFQRSLFADPWQTMFVDSNNLVWLIGTDSFEVWYNTGAGTQPFAPLSGLVGRYGIAAPWAFGLSALGNFWLARNPEGIGQVVVTRGSVPEAVSSYAVDTAIAGYLRTSSITDAEVLLYQQLGHTFATIGFPSAPATWSYDIGGQSWAERGAWNTLLGRYDLWTPRVHVVAFGKHLVGDRTTGIIWEMDPTVSTDTNGQGIRRLRRSSHLNAEHKRVPISQFELLMDVGLGLPSGQGSDPQTLLRTSFDGGRTYGTQRPASIGRMGEYRKRVVWTRLGAPPDAVFELTYTDPTPYRVIDAWLNNAEGQAA